MVCPYSFRHSGGVQKHVMGLTDWLCEQGHHVAVIAPGFPSEAEWTPPGRASFTSAGTGVPVPYNGSVARVNFDPLAAARVRRWLARENPDVVHVHEPITPSVSLLALWQAEVPVLATFHTATPHSRTMKLASRLLPATMDRIDASVAVSRSAREVARSHVGADPVVIGNGIRSHPGEPVAGPQPGVPPRVCLVGRFNEPRKGFGVFVQALTLLRRSMPEVTAVVIGEGRPQAIPGVEFTGWVDDATRDSLIASSHVYVAPHTGRESFGIVVLEALSVGTPVVASDLPAFRDVLTDAQGPLGALVEPGNPAALAAAIAATLREPHSPQRARDRAAAFDWSMIGPQILHHYRRLAIPEAMSVDRAVAAGSPRRYAS